MRSAPEIEDFVEQSSDIPLLNKDDAAVIRRTLKILDQVVV